MRNPIAIRLLLIIYTTCLLFLLSPGWNATLATNTIIYQDNFIGTLNTNLDSYNASYTRFSGSDYIYLTGNNSVYTPTYGLEYYSGPYTSTLGLQFDFKTNLSINSEKQQFGVELFARAPGVRAEDVYLEIYPDGSARIVNINATHTYYFPPGYFKNNTTYTLFISYDGIQAVIYLNGIQVDSFNNNYSGFTSGSFALQLTNYACIGKLYYTNNLTPYSSGLPNQLNCIGELTNLNVPYFSQNDLLWGQTEYDSSSGKLPNPTMDRWGCAVTSAAMVLNFHNIKEMPDGTVLDPGSLNVWLKNNNGYAIGYKNMDGWYSYLKFPSISTLTQKIFNAGKSDTKLEYKRAKTNLTQTLDSDLSIEGFPDIIKVSNNQTSSHFVVAKGKSNNTYLINDPEWNHPTLESFNNNTFSQLDRFIPSNTNLSYFLAIINPGVEMMITAPDDKKTGKNLSNNEELNEIDNASYSLQLPISNPNDNDQNEDLGTGVNEFLLSQPADGNYEIKLSSEENGFYEINLATFKENGDNDSNYIRGIITENNDETLIINYSQTENSYISKTFDDLIKDLNELKEINQFKNNGIYNSLLAKATTAQLVNFVSEKTSNNILTAMLNEINAQRGKWVTEDAYQVLFYNINYLINNP